MPPPSDTIRLPSSFRICVVVKCLCPLSHGRDLVKLVHLRKENIFSRWKTELQHLGQRASKSGHLMLPRPFVVKDVATIPEVDKAILDLQEEQVNSDNKLQSTPKQLSMDELKEQDYKEFERRMRISEQNKGRVPWNKGKKHSPETIALIRERTRLAMQNFKVRKKLAEKTAHCQSEKTREKIGISVKKASNKRREKKKLQEICLHEWEESIAEAARIGGDGEDELQWDTYEILREKINQDWFQVTGKVKKDRRAPKSVEQKKKISEAIKAKWADPEYRQRVEAGTRRHYGNEPPSTARRVVRKRSSNVSVKLPSHETTTKLSRKKSPAPYLDPLAGAKLDKIKQLRATRAEIEMQKREAVERARLLIAEAEKAAQALEAAAATDLTARASLFQTKKLLAEAIQTMQSLQPDISGHEHTLARSPVTSCDTKTLQSDSQANNSHVLASAEPQLATSFDEKTLQADTHTNSSQLPASTPPGPGHENSTLYLSFINNCKANVDDDYKSNMGNFLNGTFAGAIFDYAQEPSQSTGIGGEQVLNYAASLFSNGNLSAEETALIFKSIPDKRIGKDSMSHSEGSSAPTIITENYADTGDEPTIANTVETHMPEHMKDNILSVASNSVDSNDPTQSIAGMSESTSVQVCNNDLLTSKKDVKKRWVRGRFVEVKGD